jgi:sulfate adenylyltransferase subunit 1
MSHQSQHQGLLRFITAGSVDDGKSTLIGRLLFDSKAVLSDQLTALAAPRTSAPSASRSTSRC